MPQGSISQILDLLAYDGYKFVGCVCFASFVCVLLMATPQRHHHPHRRPPRLRPLPVYHSVHLHLPSNCVLPRESLLYDVRTRLTGLAQLRSLRSMVLPDASATAAAVNPSQRSKRITFLFLVAVAQIVYMGMLVRV